MNPDDAFAPLGGRAAAVPDGMRLYAVGDVHGRLDLLLEIEALIDADIRSARDSRTVQIMLGDYIDRGPDARGVIAHLLLRGEERDLVTLRGNHEAYVLDTQRWPSTLLHWCRYGGRETLASYGIDLGGLDEAALEAECETIARRFLAALPRDHAAFFARTRLTWRCGDYLLVHAGLRPGVAFARQEERDLLGIRAGFIDSDADFGCVVVHGHTPMREPQIRGNRIGIDTKAYESGVLTCLVLEGTSRRFLTTG